MEGESNNIKNVDNGTTSRRKKTILIGVIFSFAVGIALVVGLVVGLDNTPTSDTPPSTNNNNDPTNSDKSSGTHSFTFTNLCSENVWVGALNNPGKALPGNGGWLLTPGQSNTLSIPIAWAGRFWGRTGCNSQGFCQTGDCGGKIQCDGAGGNPPATLAEFTLDDSTGADWYDVSLVDGYNLPMQISLAPNSFRKVSSSVYDCGTAGCVYDLNAICPAALQQKNSAGQVVACLSACEKFNTDQYCCRGAFGSPSTCSPTSYSEVFKSACPAAYSYAYDDPTSTFTCHGNSVTNYVITFCPRSHTTGGSAAATTTTGSRTSAAATTTTTGHQSSGSSSGAPPITCAAGNEECNPTYQSPHTRQCCGFGQSCTNNAAGFGVCCAGNEHGCLSGSISACCPLTQACNPKGGCL